ncbi:MAG: TIR domain-containing protein [Calothrix sp. MO_192.B10]|nr:TIR domain-containing protein [Calothrix sp. MO_192.B10]
MAYRNKTYVSFDADTDMRYYRLMQAWKNNQNIDFNFYNVHDINPNPNLTSEVIIKRQLRERFANTRDFILLVGTQTRYLYKYVRWEIEQALNLDLPIIVVNLNKTRSQDEELCPPIIRDKLAIHISYNPAIVKYALDNWPIEHQQKRRDSEIGSYYYPEKIYKNLGI